MTFGAALRLVDPEALAEDVERVSHAAEAPSRKRKRAQALAAHLGEREPPGALQLRVEEPMVKRHVVRIEPGARDKIAERLRDPRKDAGSPGRVS